VAEEIKFFSSRKEQLSPQLGTHRVPYKTLVHEKHERYEKNAPKVAILRSMFSDTSRGVCRASGGAVVFLGLSIKSVQERSKTSFVAHQ